MRCFRYLCYLFSRYVLRRPVVWFRGMMLTDVDLPYWAGNYRPVTKEELAEKIRKAMKDTDWQPPIKDEPTAER